MKRRYITLMYLPDQPGKTYSFRIPELLAYVLAGVGVLLFLGTVTGILLLGKLGSMNIKMKGLTAENLVLLEENRKLQQLEENLKANTLLLRKVMGLVGVSDLQPSGLGMTTTDSVVAAFMESSEVLMNLPNPRGNDEIKEVVPSGLPAPGRITRAFNPHDENISRRHLGIDIAVKEGTKVYATADGVVEFSGWDDMFGKYIIINHSGKNGSEGFKTYYGHNLVNLVSEGEVVMRGDLIALSGNTGRSTGPHIHYEIRQNEQAVDPLEYAKNINYSIGN